MNAAGIMLTALILNWRESGEFTVIAPRIEVAGNTFSPARDMIKKDQELNDLMHVQTHTKTITHREKNATLKVVAADSNTVSGKKSIGTLVEELWLFGKQANADAMLLEATGGLASRPEGFVIYITTQSDDEPAGVFKEKLNYARKVRDGEIIDKQFVSIIYEHPPDMVESNQHFELKNLALVNPNLGYSVSHRFHEREYAKAKESDDPESAKRKFLAKYANVEIGLNLRSNRWAGADFWESAAEKTLTLDELLDRSEVCVVGIDGGGLDDLLGFAVVGRCKTTRKWLSWGHAWAHKIVLERRKSLADRFKDFASDGDLTIVERPGDDVEAVADYVMQIEDLGLLPEKAVGVDAAGIGDIVDELTARGFDVDRIIGISQGWRLNAAIKTTERKLAGKELLHGGRPFMAWCVSNARIEQRGNAVSITKQASGTAKIDPLMALLCATTLMALNPEASGSSFWEKDDV
jgi:phage terminase large subunit-like protein